ncbi:hypothetical protein [Paracraurococcus ruber]|uniref:hypothetical protein n=1 Tax=Paracraurococcus ruber TaxID=77675 RepID=UPI0013052C66|nr:hypothetical protein [Paracraurococcus ruber]
MEAIVTVPFLGVPDGVVYPKDYAVGDLVTGDLAELAVREGWAKPAKAAPKPPAPPAG